MPLKRVEATEPLWKHPAEDKTFSLDFTSVLNGASISTISAVTTTAGLTIGTTAIAGPYIEYGSRRRVDGARAVRYQLTGGTAGSNYDVTVVVVDSNSETHAGVQEIRVRST